MADAKSEIQLNGILMGKRRLRCLYLYKGNVISSIFDENRQNTILFLGSDVLAGCNIETGNFPRCHARYARKGVCVKVNFQDNIKICGLHGCNRGVWFYSVQGVFRVAFEYYTRVEQNECMKSLQGIWTRHLFDEELPDQVTVTFESRDLTNQRDVKENKDIEIIAELNQTISHMLTAMSDDNLRNDLINIQVYTGYMTQNINPDYFTYRALSLVRNCLRLLTIFPPEVDADFSEKEVFLSEVSAWLGHEFANYREHVSEKVTCFKETHIKNIQHLPTAEHLIPEVFPASMATLLRHWLTAEHHSDAGSHCQATVIQIILELANQNLLSGVAHVLYSRLVQSDVV